MKGFKRYERYKDSGVEWLGEIPEHWEQVRMKFLCMVNPLKSDLKVPRNTKVTFLPMENIGEDGTLYLNEERELLDVWNGFTYFKDDDVIIAKITPCFENGKGALCRDLINGLGFGTTELHVLRATKWVIPGFIWYVTKTHIFRIIGEAMMQGAAGQKRIPTDFIENFVVGVPSTSEQQVIAKFLDQKTAEMDSLIAGKEKLIALLQEQRQAIITQAVTKGLDPNVPMKDSGIEWIGEIPEHWEIKPLKRIAQIKYGLGEPPRELQEGLPLIRATNIERGYINVNCLMYVDPEDVPYTRDPVLRTNDIVVVRSGAYTGDSAIIPSDFDGAIAGYDMVIRVKAEVPHYVAYSLLSVPILNNQINLYRLRAAQPHLNAEELGSCYFLIPSKKEQQSIVDFLDRKTTEIDILIKDIKTQMICLTEYRQSLITAAVTGKIDVRDYNVESDQIEGEEQEEVS